MLSFPRNAVDVTGERAMPLGCCWSSRRSPPQTQAFLEKIFWFTIEPLLYNKAPKRERFCSNGDEDKVGGRDVVGVTSQKMKSR